MQKWLQTQQKLNGIVHLLYFILEQFWNSLQRKNTGFTPKLVKGRPKHFFRFIWAYFAISSFQKLEKPSFLLFFWVKNAWNKTCTFCLFLFICLHVFEGLHYVPPPPKRLLIWGLTSKFWFWNSPTTYLHFNLFAILSPIARPWESGMAWQFLSV